MSTPTKRKAGGGKSRPKAKAKGKVGTALSPETIEYLRTWMMSPEHVEHPYPNDKEKAQIMEDTGITAKQLTCWFSNNRKRYWKPKMEEMGRHAVVEAAMGNTLSPDVIEYLKAWMMHPDHIQNPYPSEEEKNEIMAATGIEKKQLTCWFSNNRKRFWKPKMDKIRAQYGLSDSDPLPPALLVTAATHAPPPPPLAGDIIDDDILAADILTAVSAPTGSTTNTSIPPDAHFAPAPAMAEALLNLDNSFAPAAAYSAQAYPAQAYSLEAPPAPLASNPLETSYAPMQSFPFQASAAPMAALPSNAGAAPGLPLENFASNFFDAAAEEPPDNKRQRASLDDISRIAV